MSWISVQNVSLAVGDKVLFSNATFTINPGDRIGIVGPNGMGKTSLLRLVSSDLDPETGHLERVGSHTITHLEQWRSTRYATLWDAAYHANPALIRMAEELSHLETQMSLSDVDADRLSILAEQWGELSEQFTHQGGYEWETIVKTGLAGIGFPANRWQDAPETLSGGEAHRLRLLQVILSGADIWLLDEPTNHLDIVTIDWVEDQLRHFAGATLIVSHDRTFLEHVSTRIMSWEDGFFWVTNGSYIQYQHLRRERLNQEATKYARYLEEQTRLQEYINKWRAGTRARQAQSRVKSLDRLNKSMANQSAPQKTSTLTLLHQGTSRGGSLPALVINQLILSHGDRRWEPLSLKIPVGARIALVGPNGTGKTTLLEALVRSSPQVRWREDITVRYLPQTAVHELPDQVTGLQYAYAMGLEREEIYYVGARFGLPVPLWETLIQGWSGGERTRLKLIETLMAPSQCLLLDEPTNHLDISMREALEELLINYPGTLFIASHDRTLLAKVSTHTLWALGDSYMLESIPFQADRNSPAKR